MPNPALCTAETPQLVTGTGDLFVDGFDVGNVVILDVNGEGDNIAMFLPPVESATDINPYMLGFQRRVLVEATIDQMTTENLELVLKESAVIVAGGERIALTTIRQEAMHEVDFYVAVGDCDGGCTEIHVHLWRAFIEQPWGLPFRRDNFTETVVRFIAFPDYQHPTQMYGYVDRACPGAGS